MRSMRPFHSYSQRVLPRRDHQQQTEGSPFCRFTHFNARVHRECVSGGAGPLLTLSWHSFPHYIRQRKKKKKGCITQPSSTWIKEGCATPLWAYLRDYQHENTTSRSSVGGRSVIVSCQTSKVPLTASYLTFSSNEFIFHSFWYFGSGSTRDQI